MAFQILVVLAMCWLKIVIASRSCYPYSTCETCIGKKAIFYCKWCPSDETCHGLLTYCASKHYFNKTQCAVKDVKQWKSYDEKMAIKMHKITIMSYDGDRKNCLKSKLGVTVAKAVNKSCDFQSHFCLAIVAVSSKDKAIVVSFAATLEGLKQLLTEAFSSAFASAVSHEIGGNVERYFSNAFKALWPDVKTGLLAQIRKHPAYDIWVTGHSLGGALASLAAVEISYHKIADSKKIRLITMGAPKVGDVPYAEAHEKLVPYNFHVIHRRDPIPHLPPCFRIIRQCMLSSSTPSHHGVEVWYPEREMAGNYRVCAAKESSQCSGGVGRLKLMMGLFGGKVEDHGEYFGVNETTVCKEL